MIVPPKKRKPPVWAGILGAVITAACCGGILIATMNSSNTPTAASTSTGSQDTLNPVAAGTGPDVEMCKIDTGAGVYWAYVTSATVHQFDICAAGTVENVTIDQLLGGTGGYDRRCIFPNAYVVAHNAIVGIYSDGKAADLAAARQVCADNHGSNQ